MTVNDSIPPRSIDDYLKALRHALNGADPALIHDALSDAEAHLRAECAARPDQSEETVLRTITNSYGSPEQVAAAYLETDQAAQKILSPSSVSSPEIRNSSGILRRFFSVYGDARSWTSLLFMLLSLFTGILYFTVAITGLTLSLGLMILIIGLPIFIGFIGLTRVLSLVEGRLVEAMTGERMPRRVKPAHTGGWLEKIGAMLRDARTWTTLIYQLLSLPLGIFYFSVAVTLSAFGLGLIGGGVATLIQSLGIELPMNVSTGIEGGALGGVAAVIFGVVMLTTLMHLARLIGRLQGKIAKRLLVQI
jgi:hypothetical protein